MPLLRNTTKGFSKKNKKKKLQKTATEQMPENVP